MKFRQVLKVRYRIGPMKTGNSIAPCCCLNLEVGDMASRLSSFLSIFFFSLSLLCNLATLLIRDLIAPLKHSPKVKLRLTVVFTTDCLRHHFKQELCILVYYSGKMCPSMSCIECLCIKVSCLDPCSDTKSIHVGYCNT